MSEKNYKVLDKPLSVKELSDLSKKDESGFITGVVPIDLDTLVEDGFDYEQFLDAISERLTGSVLLQDISYRVVGHDGNTLHIEVHGDPSSILANADEDEFVQFRDECPKCHNRDCLTVFEFKLVATGKTEYADDVKLEPDGFDVSEYLPEGVKDGSTEDEKVRCDTCGEVFTLDDLMVR